MRAGIIAAGWGERLEQKVPKALTPVGGRKLIDFTLDGLEAAGVTRVTCIVNEGAKAVPDYVKQSGRKLPIEWIIQTTPSSMHSFLIVLEHLSSSPAATGRGSMDSPPKTAGNDGHNHFLMTTVDSVCPAETYRTFVEGCQLFPEADVCLGLTQLVDDEKPLRVAMRGESDTGLMPKRLQDNPEAYEIVAMTNNGFESEFITSGFYWASPRVLDVKDAVLSAGFSALRQYLGYLLKYGYRFYGVPLPAIVDVDRPQDIRTAEHFLSTEHGAPR